jgi:hypothetical protein
VVYWSLKNTSVLSDREYYLGACLKGYQFAIAGVREGCSKLASVPILSLGVFSVKKLQ